MDCFAALAMTLIDTTSQSRGAMRPKFSISLSLFENRGRREDRVRAAPAVSRAIDASTMRTRAYRFGGEPPAFPAQWLYGLYVVVLVTGFLATIAGGSNASACLTPAPGRRTHTTSPYAAGALVSRTAASTATCPTSATMANAPPVGQDARSSSVDLPDGASGILPDGLICRTPRHRHSGTRAARAGMTKDWQIRSADQKPFKSGSSVWPSSS